MPLISEMSNKPTDAVRAGEVSMISEKICFKWIINDVPTTLMEKGDAIESPTFKTYINHSETVWLLKFYPKGGSDAPAESATVRLIHLTYFTVPVTITLNVFTNDQEVLKGTTSKYLFMKDKNCIGFHSIINNQRHEQTLLNDKFTIICEIEVDESDFDRAGIEFSECPLRLRQFDDFGKLLDNDKFSDIIFKVESKQLRAHKAILAARSEVFAAMFEHDRLEKRSNVVEIQDVSYDIMRQVFEYLYTGSVCASGNTAGDLLIAANKYCIDGLKKLCEKILNCNLTIDNALECLTLADAYNADHLKAKSIEFILEHAEQVVETEGFKSCEKSHSIVVYDLFRAMLNKEGRKKYGKGE